MDLPRQGPFQEYETFIPDIGAFHESLCTPLPVCLRTNTLRIAPSELTRILRDQGYTVRSSFLADYLLELKDTKRLGSALEAALGYFLSQALTSALAVMVLDPRPDEFICDICAAPGSKTTHMAQLMDNQGLIIANDNKEKRLRALEHNVKRLGITNVVTTLYAGQNFPRRWKFDRILADVPCSGEGKLRFSTSSARFTRRAPKSFLSRIQRGLLLQAFDLLADTGILLYSTCTYNPAENEEVVQYLLENRPAEVLPIELSAPHAHGLLQWRNSTYDQQMEQCWRIYPHQINSVGFFLAKIGRRSSSK